MIAIKPHHFVDIVAACGQGRVTFEPHPYGHAVHSVAHEILANLDVVLRIELGADDICRPCRHHADGHCDDTIDTSYRPAAPSPKQAYNLLLDQRWAERLGLQSGDTLTARKLCQRIQARAADISDIYRENPPERVAAKQGQLQQGLTRLLGQIVESPTGARPRERRCLDGPDSNGSTGFRE